MAVMTPNPLPGPYLEGQNVHFTFSADITSVAYTTDGTPPSISKYIAYDTLVPPNPFIAVTEDGRGRVVYDGGFPKFYNGQKPIVDPSFADLNAGGKYFYNAIRWISNPEEVAAGNKKVLVLCDAIVTENYSIKSTNGTGFADTLQRLFHALDVPYVLKDRDDYGGVLNPTLEELETYACVVVFSTRYTAERFISEQAVNDLVTYRENGNGIFLITDHGDNLSSIQQAQGLHTGFFRTANFICTNFGAYFNGNFDRVPVNVGFLRSNYGDHPLYNGMLDSEDVYAGGSESKVTVTTANVFDPSLFPVIRVDKKGINTIQVLGITNTGEIVTGRYVYIIQGDEFVFAKTVNPTTGLEETNVGKAYADLFGRASMTMWVDGSLLGTVWGEIKLNGKRIGELHYTGAGGSKVYWYAGKLENTPLDNADVIQQAIAVPFGYTKSITALRTEVPTSGIALASVVAVGRSTYKFKGVAGSVKSFFDSVKPKLPVTNNDQPLSCGENGMMFFGLFSNKYQFEDVLNARIYATAGETSAAIAATPVTPGICFIDASTNKVYGYLNGAFRLITGLKAQDFYGAPRVITNATTGRKFRLELNGTITLL